MQCESSKKIWDKIQNINKEYDNVQKEKLRTYWSQFKILKMKDEEHIATYFCQIDEVVNTIKGLGETIKETVVVQKALRSIPLCFDAKVSTIQKK